MKAIPTAKTGCLYVPLGIFLFLLLVDASLEWNYQRTPNQMAILSDHVGGFSCPDAKVMSGDWDGPSVFKAGDFYDELNIVMPKSCLAALEQKVRTNTTFRFENCTKADVCWTNAGARRTRIELHFLDDRIIFRNMRI